MFVDNSASAHKSFKWALKDEPYHTFIFDNPVDALSALKVNDFAAVVVDEELLKMKSVTFLKSVKEISPDTVGIIMTEYIGSKTATQAIRNGYVMFFIKKPWEVEKLKQAVAMAVGHYQINVEIRQLYPDIKKTSAQFEK